MSDADTNPVKAGEHMGLRGSMSDLSTSLARLEGKIDTQTTLLTKAFERQDRADDKISDLEKEMRSEVRRIEEKGNVTSNRVWMGIGAVGFVGILPALIAIIGSMKV